jgi:hypothetical protein
MKTIILFLLPILITACYQSGSKVQQLHARVDSLQKELNNSYKPGFGEFMSSIQVHHAKLWFAGINENWKLAGFEIHEIQEALESIQKFNSDRPESNVIGMINPALDSVTRAVRQQSRYEFKSSFILLTNTCNNCHKATKHEFNVVIIPANPPIGNQSFKPVQ